MSTLHIKIPKLTVPKLTQNGDVALTRGQLNKDIPEGAKVCYVCKTLKDCEDFGVNRTRPDGLQTYCRKCAKDQQTKWYYQRKYKLSLADRDAMLAAQGGKCMICKNPTEFQFKKGVRSNIGDFAVVDHCHDVGKIRGILCGFCNTGLGSFRDNPTFLENAIQYLLETAEK